MITKKMQWFYRYQPYYKDIVLPKTFKNTFDKYIELGNLPNLLFYSDGPGVGKSSLLDGLAEIMNFDVFHTNVGGENSIQILKSRIMKFNKKGTLKSGKLIVFEEAGNMNKSYQEALKDFIDIDLKNTCVAMTTNTIHTLLPALQNRFFTYNFDFGEDKRDEMVPQIKQYLKNILVSENVEYLESNLDEIIDKKFPTIRSMVNIIQMTFYAYGDFKGEIKYGIEPEDFVKDIKERNFDDILGKMYESNITFNEIYKYIRVFINTKDFIVDDDKRMELLELLEDSQRFNSVPDIELHFLHLFVLMNRLDLF